MKIVAVIPARWASSRYPGKPLADVGGKPMIQRVYEQARACEGIADVIIATDDERILHAAQSFGARAVMTDAACASGTDRVAQAVRDIEAGAVINIQGDQVVLDTAAIVALAGELERGCPMATVALAASGEDAADPNTVKVVLDREGYALYFSRAAIPYPRSPGQAPLLKHVGLYGFSRETLFRFTALPQSPLELTESLEQLRALENGIRIKVVIAEGAFHEINTPQDHARVVERCRD
ncbi:MAG TPA: 3-deoxy-manno-octulosonate cytidylyltransferase [Syntrophus sp. (in: bacteria)]|nr:3-deoxy-manno-octulosonate cytidylyltransferase [Syntrophus sp. (in: bacteria)]